MPARMNFNLYLIFLVTSLLTIATPGPGVLMATSNALQYGLRRAMPGIFGCAVGTLIVAAVSMTALGAIIAASPTLYTAIKAAGVCFLIYLGWKKFVARPLSLNVLRDCNAAPHANTPRALRVFAEGVVLQMSNPGLIIFYLSLFPQCIDPARSYVLQVSILSLNYSLFLWLIHSAYAWIAATASARLTHGNGALWINRAAGACYWLLAVLFGVPILLN